MSHYMDIRFGGADLAAAAAPTTANTPLLGLGDVADTAVCQLPFATEIVGIQLSGAPAAGDTVQVLPFVGAGPASANPTTTITNAIPTQTTWLGPGQGIPVAANTNIGLQYKTTTTGAYTAKDVWATLWLRVVPMLG